MTKITKRYEEKKKKIGILSVVTERVYKGMH